MEVINCLIKRTWLGNLVSKRMTNLITFSTSISKSIREAKYLCVKAAPLYSKCTSCVFNRWPMGFHLSQSSVISSSTLTDVVVYGSTDVQFVTLGCRCFVLKRQIAWYSALTNAITICCCLEWKDMNTLMPLQKRLEKFWYSFSATINTRRFTMTKKEKLLYQEFNCFSENWKSSESSKLSRETQVSQYSIHVNVSIGFCCIVWGNLYLSILLIPV